MKLIQGFSSKLIPVILIGAAVIVGAISLISMQTDDDPPSVSLNPAGVATLDSAATRLKQPGLYVAEGVPYSRLSGAEFQELKASIGAARVPIRVAVLPAAITRDGRIEAKRLIEMLHRRVSKPGVYAVLVDTRGIGRLEATYWPTKAAAADAEATTELEEAVAAAVADANDCCTRDYSGAIEKFVERSLDTPNRALSMMFWLVLFVAAVFGVWWRWLRRTDHVHDVDAADDEEIIDAMSSVLKDEVQELAHRVAALPQVDSSGVVNPAIGGTVQTASRATKCRKLLTSAEARLAQLAGSRNRSLSEVTDTVRTLAELRYELFAIEALRLGRGVPLRTPPCFIDPRHGPSEVTSQVSSAGSSDNTVTFAPTGLAERPVRVCGHCATEIKGGQRPAIRRLPRTVHGGGSGWANYWEADAGSAYVDGYWGDAAFPDEDFESRRTPTVSTGKQDPIAMLKQRLRTDRE